MRYASRSIPITVKRAVLARDGYSCVWCLTPVAPRGSGPPRPDELHFDHLTPWAAGGEHTADNLVIACRTCNLLRKRPRNSVRLARARVEYRYSAYWWPEGYTPPLLADPVRVVQRLEDVTCPRYPLERLVHMIHRGELPATGPGEPICVDLPDGWERDDSRAARRRRRVSR